MDMLEADSWLWRWLADQPAYIEVGIGMFFVLAIAPAVLTAVAVALTRAEAIAESLAVGRFTVPSPRSSESSAAALRRS